MKINVEEIFFDGIEELYLNTDIIDNAKYGFKLQMKKNNKYDNYRLCFDLYMKYLNNKFNNDNVKINLFILDKFIKRHKTESVINIDNVLSDFTITSMQIKFIDGRKIIINTPIKNKQEKHQNNINKYLKVINYSEIKNSSIDDLYGNIFDIYMKNVIDNIIVFDSSISSRFELFRENNNTTSLYVFSNKSDDKELLLMIIEDYLNKNSHYIDRIIYTKEKLFIKFNNEKYLEIKDKKLLGLLNNKIDKLSNELIDRKLLRKK